MWFLLFSIFFNDLGVVAQLLQILKIVSTLRSYYQMTTWIHFHLLIPALYSILQMLKIFQMKKKVTNFRTNMKFLNVKRKMTLTMKTQSVISRNPAKGIEKSRKC